MLLIKHKQARGPWIFVLVVLTLVCCSRGYSQDPAYLSGLKVEDLFDPHPFIAIANGRERGVEQLINRKDVDLQILIDGYVTAYGLLCPAYLPADKVPWTIKTCSNDDQGQYECVDHETPLYIDKNIYDLKKQLLDAYLAYASPAGASLEGMLYLMQKRFQTLLETTDETHQRYYRGIWLDSFRMVKQNGCDSAELRRYQDNLIRFGLGQRLLTAAYPMFKPGTGVVSSPPLPINAMPRNFFVNFNHTDYIKLVHDIANSWKDRNRNTDFFLEANDISFPRFIIMATDSQGLPTLVSSHGQTLSGSPATLSITFHGGQPTEIRKDGDLYRSFECGDRIVEKFEAGFYKR